MDKICTIISIDRFSVLKTVGLKFNITYGENSGEFNVYIHLRIRIIVVRYI